MTDKTMTDTCLGCLAPLPEPDPGENDFFERMKFDFAGYSAVIPQPLYCPSCRHQNRFSFRNEQRLYHRISAASGKKILSLYHPEPLVGEPFQVMLEEEWRAQVDPYAYGRDIDFARPFFEQYAELQRAVPRMSIVNLQNENSPYTSHTGYSKSCYLLPCSEYCEYCYYGRFLQSCTNCVDCTSAEQSELCYECFQISNCYRCGFLSLSQNCNECYFSEALIGCRCCLFSTNLRRAEYCIFNNPVGPAEFEKQASEILSSADKIERARQTWLELIAKRPRRAANIRNSEDCAGDYILDSRNCRSCTDITACEDCRDLIIGYKIRDSRSCSNIYLDCELNYELIGSAQIYHCAFGFYVFRSRDILYSEYIYDSHDLFGCIGITRGEYSILNKKFSPQDYGMAAARLVEHMKNTGEWGQTLPPRFSPFGYNETIANDFIQLERDQALRRGFTWRDTPRHELGEPSADRPPDKIADCGIDLAKETFRCTVTGEPYRIISRELEFYLNNRIAPPRLSPAARHKRREALRFPARFRLSKCANCGCGVETNVPLELSGALRCEDCYLAQF